LVIKRNGEVFMCEEKGNSVVRVEVDVTKIVKYVCLTGVFIVGIIFGCNAWSKVMKDGRLDMEN
jgi:predicted type IV restriction endonuclease